MRAKEKPRDSGGEISSLPPRGMKHRSEKGKWLRIFYLTLVLLFIGLAVGLMLWGRQLTLSPAS